MKNKMGFIDPSFIIIALAILIIDFLGISVIQQISKPNAFQQSILSSARLIVGAIIVAAFHVLIVVLAVIETYDYAHSSGKRLGSISLKGWILPISVLICYLIGIWRLARVSWGKHWGIIIYSTIPFLLIVASVSAQILSNKRARKNHEEEQI